MQQVLRKRCSDRLLWLAAVLTCGASGCSDERTDDVDVAGAGSAIITTASGVDYIEECLDEGVPIPDTIIDEGAGWVNRGVLSTTFIGDLADDNEIWSWESADPERPGVCLALPRWNNEDEANLFGIICLGTLTGRACFFDNDSGDEFLRSEPRSINDFIGGVDLLTNGQGACTACHAGENPFIVHPDDEAFTDLVDSGVLRPSVWYQPIIGADPDWPHNPGPMALPPPPTGEGDCASCHDETFAGRFPDIANLPSGGYCDSVLAPALSTPTMPAAPMQGGNFSSHSSYMLSLCGTGPGIGTLEDVPGTPDDPEFVSPPEVMPMYACAHTIGVRNAKLGATVELEGTGAGGPWVLTGVVRDPGLTTFVLPFETADDQAWRARQDFDGTWSEFSASEVPRSYLEDFPMGLPAVSLAPPVAHECGQTVAAMHVAGATLTMDHDGDVSQHDGSPSGYSVVWANSGLVETQEINVYQSLCGDDGPWMASPVVVDEEPFPLSVLATAPAEVYEGQELVLLAQIVPGSVQSASSSVSGALSPFPSWPTQHRIVDVGAPLGRALLVGEELTATQTLCEPVSTPFTSAPALDCALAPPAQIVYPNAGETYVMLADPGVPGASTRVWSDDSMAEIGDSGGSRITLSRPLVSGETIRVMRDLTGCTSGGHFVYVVN